MEQMTELKRRDHAAWLCMLPFRETSVLFTLLAIWTLALAYTLLMNPVTGMRDVAMTVVGSAIFYWPGFGLFWIIFSVLYAMRSSAQSGWHRYQLSNEGLLEQNTAGQLITRWDNVRSIRLTAHYVFIGLTGKRYHILPRRCFDTSEQLHGFYRAVKGYLNQPDDFPQDPKRSPITSTANPKNWKNDTDEPWR